MQNDAGEDGAEPDVATKAGSMHGDALVAQVRQSVDDVLRGRRLDVQQHGAWQVLHGVLAYGDSLQIVVGDQSVLALDYLLGGGGLTGFDPSPGDTIGGRRGLRLAFQPSTKVGQGHRDQWLAILSQCDLTLDQDFMVPWGRQKLGDVLRQAEWDVPLNYEAEFSWTLIGLSAYQSTEHAWVARDGNTYSSELLLQSELSGDIDDSVCGGTHRLIGIAMAVRKRRAESLPMTGAWAEAEAVLDAAVDLARQNQNGDGSFSPSYLHRTGWARDLGEQLGTTGHVLEFLALAAPKEDLRSHWVERTVKRVCELLDQCREEDLECGVLYHAVHGLQEYLVAIEPGSKGPVSGDHAVTDGYAGS